MRKYIIAYIFLSISILAQSPSVLIKTLVEKIKKAKPEDRRVLINQLKLELRKVNEEKRRRSILELKRSLNSKKGDSSSNCYTTNSSNRDHTHAKEGRKFRRMIFRGHR